MESKKTSKKDIRIQLKEAISKAVTNLALPAPTKKIKKLIERDSKKLATIYFDIIRREEKKKRKAEKFLGAAVNGTAKAVEKKKAKKAKPAKG